MKIGYVVTSASFVTSIAKTKRLKTSKLSIFNQCSKNTVICLKIFYFTHTCPLYYWKAISSRKKALGSAERVKGVIGSWLYYI